MLYLCTDQASCNLFKAFYLDEQELEASSFTFPVYKSSINEYYDLSFDSLKEQRQMSRIKPGDPFVAQNILAYVVTGNYQTAKTQAIKNAIKDGIEQVLRRVCVDAQALRYFAFEQLNIEALVEKVEICYERVNHSSYKGIFNIYFKRQSLESEMSAKGLRFGVKFFNDIVVIPLLLEDGNYTLFDGNESWLKAWANMQHFVGLAEIDTINNIEILNSSAIDFAQVKFDKLMTMSYSDMIRTLSLQNSTTVSCIIAKYTDRKNLAVNLRLLKGAKEQRFSDTYIRNNGESEEDFFAKSVRNIGLAINQIIQGKDPNSSKNRSILHIINDNPTKWAQIKDCLDKINAISHYRMRQNNKQDIELELHYIVEPKEISAILLHGGLTVKEDAENKKIILDLVH